MRMQSKLTTQVPVQKNGQTVMVTVNIICKNEREWEALDDTINDTAELVAHLPDTWEIDVISRGHCWLWRPVDNMAVVFYIGDTLIHAFPTWENSAYGNDIFRGGTLPDGCPEKNPNIRISRNRGIATVAKDFQRRLVDVANQIMPFNLAYISEVAAEVALVDNTAERVATSLKSDHRHPDTFASFHRGERRGFGLNRRADSIRWQVDGYAGTELTIYVADPDQAVALVNAARDILWPPTEAPKPEQHSLFGDEAGTPLFSLGD